MKIFAKYISFIYIKYFLIIFLALELFFVGIELINSFSSIPKSANLIVLFMVFSACTAVSIIAPLSVVLALIASLVHLIRSGELVPFYALGISKSRLIMPAFVCSIVIILALILSQATPLAYAKDYKNAIMNQNLNSVFRLNAAFIKSENKYIYFTNITPNSPKVPLVYVFELKDDKLERKITAVDAEFSDGKWRAKNVLSTSLPPLKELGGEGIKNEILSEYEILEGFEPQLLSNLNKNASSYSIIHAIKTLWQVKDDAINLSVIKTALYLAVFFPFFAPFMLIILYSYAPILSRFNSIALLSFGSVVITLCIWGVIYALSKLSASATIPAELGIIAPVAVLGAFAFYRFRMIR